MKDKIAITIPSEGILGKKIRLIGETIYRVKKVFNFEEMSTKFW